MLLLAGSPQAVGYFSRALKQEHGFRPKCSIHTYTQTLILVFSMRKCHPMCKTSEAVVFSARILSPCSMQVRMFLNRVEAKCRSPVCPTLDVHPKLWPET